MNKEQLMNYCWCRDFKYGELKRISGQMDSNEIPTKEEYKEYYLKQQDKFEEWCNYG